MPVTKICWDCLILSKVSNTLINYQIGGSHAPRVNNHALVLLAISVLPAKVSMTNAISHHFTYVGSRDGPYGGQTAEMSDAGVMTCSQQNGDNEQPQRRRVGSFWKVE